VPFALLGILTMSDFPDGAFGVFHNSQKFVFISLFFIFGFSIRYFFPNPGVILVCSPFLGVLSFDLLLTGNHLLKILNSSNNSSFFSAIFLSKNELIESLYGIVLYPYVFLHPYMWPILIALVKAGFAAGVLSVLVDLFQLELKNRRSRSFTQ